MMPAEQTEGHGQGEHEPLGQHEYRHGHEHHGHGHHGERRAYGEMGEAEWGALWERQRGREGLARGWLDALGVELGCRLVDVGSGPGFVSLLAAERVGPAGRVCAVDQAAAALDFLRARLAEAGVDGVEPVVGAADAIPLSAASADRALVADMLHHNADPPAILREVLRVLAPGGAALVVEYDPAGSEASGPPAADRLPAGQVEEWLAAAGYARCETRTLDADHYGVLAYKPVG